jgi:hypothetical protein
MIGLMAQRLLRLRLGRWPSRGAGAASSLLTKFRHRKILTGGLVIPEPDR